MKGISRGGKKIKKIYCIVTFVMFLFFVPGNINVNADDGGVLMKINKSDIQNPEIQSWFDLNTSKFKGKEIELSATFTNTSKEKKEIVIEKTNVITVQNGGLDYVDEPKTEYTGALNEKVILKDHIKDLPEEISFEPEEEKVVTFKVLVPKENGQYLVGIAYYHKEKEDKVNNEEGGVQVKQRLRYATPILMTNSIEMNRKLEVNNVLTEFERGTPRILMELENDNNMMESSRIHYSIKNKKDDNVVFEGETNDFLMAPYTYIKYPISWNGDMEKGQYYVEITVKQKMGNDKIEESKKNFDIEINKKEIEKVEQGEQVKVIYKDKETPWLTYALIVVIGFLFFLLFKRKKEEKDGYEDRYDEETEEDFDEIIDEDIDMLEEDDNDYR